MTLELRELSQAECYEFLEHERYGHLACCNDGRPYVASVYYAFAGYVAYSFTMPGRKLDTMRANGNVCLHVERRHPSGGWTTVVVEGEFEEFPDNETWRSERIHAWELLQRHSDWWETGSLKPEELPVLTAPPHVFYGILVKTVSGRSAVPRD